MQHTDIVCPFCGCLCDDIEITIKDGHIEEAKNACTISRSKFLNTKTELRRHWSRERRILLRTQ